MIEKSKFATGVSVQDNYLTTDIKNPCIAYNISCGCGEIEHTLRVNFDIDENCGNLDVVFYAPFEHCVYEYDKNFIKKRFLNFKNRLKKSIKLLLTGHLDMTAGIYFNDNNHLQNFIDALIEGQTKMKKIQEKINN